MTAPMKRYLDRTSVGGILTRERRKAYLSGKETQCPYCGSPDITGGSVEIESPMARQEITCSACSEVWVDVYRLCSMMERIGNHPRS